MFGWLDTTLLLIYLLPLLGLVLGLLPAIAVWCFYKAPRKSKASFAKGLEAKAGFTLSL